MRVTLTTMRGDGKLKREWDFYNPRDGFAFWLASFREYRRDEARGRFKMTGRWNKHDQRSNTIEPPPHDFLKPQLAEAIAEQVEIISEQ
jgi:hypothetical protein